MKQYFFAEHNSEKGPYTIEELKKFRIKNSTLVWTEGMPDWIEASKVPELKEIIISSPPPIPSKRISTPPSSPPQTESMGKKVNIKYDYTSPRFYGLTVVGIIILFAQFIFTVIQIEGNALSEESLTNAIGIMLAFHVLFVYLSYSSAKRQNRSTAWAFFTFFFPSISLIIQGLLRRKNYPPDYSTLSNEQKASIDYDCAVKFHFRKHNDEALFFIERAIKRSPENQHYKEFKTKIQR